MASADDERGPRILAHDAPLTDAEVETWSDLNGRVAPVLNARNIEHGPIVHYEAPAVIAALYRLTVPLRIPLLGHTRWP
jgi:hypothetical protein